MVFRFSNGSEVEVNLLSLTPWFGILVLASYSVAWAAGATISLGVVFGVLRALTGGPEPPRIEG